LYNVFHIGHIDKIIQTKCFDFFQKLGSTKVVLGSTTSQSNLKTTTQITSLPPVSFTIQPRVKQEMKKSFKERRLPTANVLPANKQVYWQSSNVLPAMDFDLYYTNPHKEQ
jgi:hypothetical protein